MYAHYAEKAQQAGDATIASIFRSIRGDEMGHRQTFSTELRRLPGEGHVSHQLLRGRLLARHRLAEQGHDVPLCCSKARVTTVKSHERQSALARERALGDP